MKQQHNHKDNSLILRKQMLGENYKKMVELQTIEKHNYNQKKHLKQLKLKKQKLYKSNHRKFTDLDLNNTYDS